MDTLPVELLRALSDDLLLATNQDLNSLRSYPSIPPDSSHTLASAISIAHSITKKFLPSDSESQDVACWTKFCEINRSSQAWELRLNTSGDEELWGTFKKVLWDFFNPGGVPLVGSLDDIFLEGRCGPGASIAAANGDFYTKMFSSALSCSSQGLVKHYETRSAIYPTWLLAESFRKQHHSEARIVQSSKISFVPKNVAISRMICTEPTLNMYYQLGLGRIIEKRLVSYFKIDMSTQPDINRELACLGSLAKHLWSTIDLESASDTLSVGLCKDVIPPCIFQYLNLLRSKSATYRGDTHVLHMMSTMGNGFTFPLQTALFAAMVKAVYLTLGYKANKIDVFGDDLVIYTGAATRVCRLLELAGCRVNATKSFFAGPFRESCGHDYFAGHNVRGVYAKRYTSVQDSYVLINLLNQYTAKTGLMLRNAVRWLAKRVDRSLEIPCWEDPAGGIRMPYSMVRSRHATRKSRELQGTPYILWTFKPRKVRIGDGYIPPINGRRLTYNPDGLLLAFVSGMALSSGIPLRNQGVWKKKRRCCSFWNDVAFSPELRLGFGQRQWETAVYANLIS